MKTKKHHSKEQHLKRSKESKKKKKKAQKEAYEKKLDAGLLEAPIFAPPPNYGYGSGALVCGES